MLRISFIFLILFSSISNLLAANSLSYSGRLVLASGAPVTGPVNLRAELVYTNAISTILCSQDLSSVALTKGVFHLKLDLNCAPKTMNQVLAETPNGESVAIRIIDQSNSKTYPLQAIHSVPFSKVAEQLPQMGASAGQALAWDGSKWAPTSVGTGNGTVMSVTAGTGLSGGTITTTGTIGLAAGGVGTTELANNSVTAAKINAGEITSSHISATANIPYSKLSIGVGEIPQDRINGLAGSMSALIEDVIADAVTGKAPSQNAVYDALGLKADRANVAQNITAASVVGLVAPTVGSAAANRDYVDNSATTLDTRITNEVATLNTTLGNKYDKAGGVITGDVTLNTQLLLKGGANFVTVKANSATSNYVMTLPTSAGTNGYVLRTDGAGVLSWVDPTSITSGTSTVDSNSITDGSIVDADINAAANIAQSKILNLTTDLAGKQPLITAGTTAQYYRGDKTFVDLGTDVRGTNLTGYTVGTNTALVAGDTTLGAFQKIQGQINATNTAVAGKEPTLATGTTSQYYRGDKTWQALDGAAVGNTPAGTIAATNVQTALNELDSEKQANITATSAITTGSVTTSLQNGVNINPFNTGAGQTGELRFYELSANGSHYTSFKAPDALAANINYVMPSAAPAAGQVLSSSGAGVLSWISIPSAPVTTVFGRSGAVTATAGDYTATLITNTPAGSIAGTTVQAAINELDSEKQGLITAGTTAQYYRGDKTFVDFGTDVRGTALTGYTVGTNTALTATDSTLAAFQKVQGQINATNIAVAGKEPTITSGTTAQYIRGDKTLSTFATDVINSVLSSFTVGTGTKPAVVNTDTVAGAFGKVQKTLNDINADYVSKSQDQTINGTLAINSATGFITVPTPINPNDAASKAYVDSYGQWLENGANIYFNTGNVGIGTSSPSHKLDVNGSVQFGTNTATSSNIVFSPSAAAQGYIRMTSDASANYIQSGLDSTIGSTRDLRFSPSFTTAPWMTIQGSTGNVGIGTAAPQSGLDIKSALLLGVSTDVSIGPDIKFMAQGLMASESNLFINIDSDNNASGDLIIAKGTETSSSSPLLTVKNDGKVGIGTSTPSEPLHILKNDGVANGEHWLFRAEKSAAEGGVVIGYEADGTNFVAAKVRSSSNADLIFGTTGFMNMFTLKNNGTANFRGNNIPRFNPSMGMQLGDQDWTDFISQQSGTFSYSSADKGIKTTGDTWFILNSRIPIDPLGVYRVTVRIKKIDGTGSVYVGADSLDSNFNSIKTDSENSYNYFAAQQVTVAPGSTYVASGTISGHNIVGGTGDDRFDPNAKYFNVIIITNYQGTGNSVVESVEIHKLPTLEPWRIPTFENAWTNYGNSYGTAAYFKDNSGIVHIRGLIAGGTINTCAFTLPVGYRPAFRILRATQTHNSVLGRVDIQSNGCVTPVVGDASWFSLDGINFRTD